MPLYRLTDDSILALSPTSFADIGILERADLQRLLRRNIEVVAPDVLIIAEEFGEWEDSRRRIDLLGIDREANLVVLELKRDSEGGHMELQAIRYAAMVSRMTFQRAVKLYREFLRADGGERDARKEIENWFGSTTETPNDDSVLGVRIILIAADFQKEITTAVLWLREWEIDIRCIRVKPYLNGNEIVLDVQPIVPLPEASEYQIAITDGLIERKQAGRSSGEFTGYWFMNTGEEKSKINRTWNDCRKYGFLTAGGSAKYQLQVQRLKVGDKVFAYLKGHGYVGVGEVMAAAVPMRQFVPAGRTEQLSVLPLEAMLFA